MAAKKSCPRSGPPPPDRAADRPPTTTAARGRSIAKSHARSTFALPPTTRVCPANACGDSRRKRVPYDHHVPRTFGGVPTTGWRIPPPCSRPMKFYVEPGPLGVRLSVHGYSWGSIFQRLTLEDSLHAFAHIVDGFSFRRSLQRRALAIIPVILSLCR